MKQFRGVGIDQFGERFYFRQYPRKEMMEELGCKHASKMYADWDGESHHIGYVINGHWIRVYRLEIMG